MGVANDSGGVETRRTVVASLLMGVGVIAGYGLGLVHFFRYLVPLGKEAKQRELFVGTLDRMPVGANVRLTDPRGQAINIVRTGDDREHPERGFKALSSKCPHLGCHVHWEAGKDCFLCPCHQGIFDKTGVAQAGPPAKEGRNLETYPVRVDRASGWVFVMVTEGEGYGV